MNPRPFSLPPSLSLSVSFSSSSSVRSAGQSLLLESPPVPPRCGSSTNIGSGQSPRFARGFRLETHRPECYSCRVTETAAISGRFLSYPVFQQHATCSFLSAPRNRRRLHVSFSFRKRPRFRPRFPHLVSSRLPFFFPPSLLTPRRTPTDGQTGRPPLASPTRTPGMLFTMYVREISALEPERRERERERERVFCRRSAVFCGHEMKEPLVTRGAMRFYSASPFSRDDDLFHRLRRLNRDTDRCVIHGVPGRSK